MATLMSRFLADEHGGFSINWSLSLRKLSTTITELLCTFHYLIRYTKMSFPYKKVLIIGATSGIGKTLADKVVQNGSKLIAAGRRNENLQELLQRHGSDKVSTKTFDVMQLEQVWSSAQPVEMPN